MEATLLRKLLKLEFIVHPAQPSKSMLCGVHSIFGLPHDLQKTKGTLAISEDLNINPINFLRPPFNSQFCISFNFYFSHKTPGGLKT